MIRKRLMVFLAVTLLIIASGFIYAWLNYSLNLGIPCIYKSLLGISCPGCGLTRATISLMLFDIKSAFLYNAIFPVYWFEIMAIFISSGIGYVKTGEVRIRGINLATDIMVAVIIIVYGILRPFI